MTFTYNEARTARFVSGGCRSFAEEGGVVNQGILLEAVRTVEKLFARGRNIFDFLDAQPEQDRMPDPAYAAALVRI